MNESATQLIRSVFGLPCWQVRWDCQVGLDMNFGAPRLEIREPLETREAGRRDDARKYHRSVWLWGTHALAVVPGCWRLEIADGTIARDTSRGRVASMAVARLKGEKLEGLTIDARTGATTFFFDLGARLIVRSARHHANGIELWSLSNSSRVVKICPGGLYQFGSRHQDLETLRERPVAAASLSPLIVARTRKFERQLRENSA